MRLLAILPANRQVMIDDDQRLCCPLCVACPRHDDWHLRLAFEAAVLLSLLLLFFSNANRISLPRF